MNNRKTKIGSAPTMVTLKEPLIAVGLTMKTSRKSVFRDVTKILKQYMGYKENFGIPSQKLPWEYVSLSRNFEDNQTWNYLTGHVVSRIDKIPEVFTTFEIPTGVYAVFPVRPGFKFMLGFEIGKLKKYIYENWLPNSTYEFAGHEFEYNNEKMFRENPHYIDIYVAVVEKAKNKP